MREKTLLFKAFVVLGLVFEHQTNSNTQIAIEADLVFVLHWRRLCLRQETKINALSREANNLGQKKKKLKNFACINFRESVNIEFFAS